MADQWGKEHEHGVISLPGCEKADYFNKLPIKYEQVGHKDGFFEEQHFIIRGFGTKSSALVPPGAPPSFFSSFIETILT